MATPCTRQDILRRSGASQAVWRCTDATLLTSHCYDRVDILERFAKRSFTVPTGIWDFGPSELSPDLSALVGNSDGFQLNGFSMIDDSTSVFWGDWDVGVMGWTPDSSKLIGDLSNQCFVTIDIAADFGKQLRHLPGHRQAKAPLLARELDAAEEWLGGGGTDGHGWVIHIATEAVTPLPAAPNPCSAYTLHFVHGTNDVVHTGPGGHLWRTRRDEPTQSLRLPPFYAGKQLQRLVAHPKLMAIFTEGGLFVADFTKPSPQEQTMLAPSHQLQHWLDLPYGNLWLTVAAPAVEAKLWKFDGKAATLHWRRRIRKRTIARIVCSRSGRTFGLVDNGNLLYLYDATYFPPRRLVKLQLPSPRTDVAISRTDTHVIINEPLQDAYIKRIQGSIFSL